MTAYNGVSTNLKTKTQLLLQHGAKGRKILPTIDAVTVSLSFVFMEAVCLVVVGAGGKVYLCLMTSK